MIAGVDCHKANHSVVLIDDNGAKIGSTTVQSTPEGLAELVEWFEQMGATGCVVGVENGLKGWGRHLCLALISNGHTVVNVPAFRVIKNRRHQGGGKNDQRDALGVAQVVLRDPNMVGRVLPEKIVDTVTLIYTSRSQLITDRTKQIQRLRAILCQSHPQVEKETKDLTDTKQVTKLKRLRFDLTDPESR